MEEYQIVPFKVQLLLSIQKICLIKPARRKSYDTLTISGTSKAIGITNPRNAILDVEDERENQLLSLGLAGSFG